MGGASRDSTGLGALEESWGRLSGRAGEGGRRGELGTEGGPFWRCFSSFYHKGRDFLDRHLLIRLPLYARLCEAQMKLNHDVTEKEISVAFEVVCVGSFNLTDIPH